MTLYFGDGIGDDPPTRNNDKIFTDDGYMLIGGQLIDLNEPPKTQKTEKASTHHFTDDDWRYL